MDYYALTMSQALFEQGKHQTRATFHAFARHAPWSYFVVAGQEVFTSWIRDCWNFDEGDKDFLRASGDLSGGFLDLLFSSRLSLTVDAMLEGEIAFANEPVCRVTGPVWQCLLVEAALLNSLTSQSSSATNATQVCEAAAGQPVFEFGLRRCHSIGGLEASRGSYIGGCAGTSNLLAAQRYHIPPAGTCSHAFVMLYENELEAFRDYAKSHKSQPVFLVDTYDTKQGIENAVQVCKDLEVELGGIRIDSGDLQYLSIFAREILTSAQFQDAKIIASNNLSPGVINQIRRNSEVDIWGVGTHLSALKSSIDFVYKLGAVHGDEVRPVMKFSEDRGKMTLPGELDVLRFTDEEGMYLSDCIVPLGLDALKVASLSPLNCKIKKVFEKESPRYKPLIPLMKNGDLVRKKESLGTIRERVKVNLARLDESYKRLINPHKYIVGVEESLVNLQESMIRE